MTNDKYNVESLQKLLNITADLSANLDIDSILNKINTYASELVSSEVSSILLFDDKKSHLYFKVASGKRAPILKKFMVTDGIAWWVAQEGEPVIVEDVNSDSRFTGSIDKVANFETKNVLCVPIVLEQEIMGVLEAINKIDSGEFTEVDLDLFSNLSKQIAVVIKNAKDIERLQNFKINAIEILVKAIESVGSLIGISSLKDPGHCWRVAEVSIAIAENLNREINLDHLYYGAILHDIGILDHYYIQNSYKDIKSHPVLGAEMIENITSLREAAPIIRHHHEHYNGSGYPDGLKGEEIPLGARIVAAAETYEKIFFERELERKNTVKRMKQFAGTKLDPEIIKVFENFINGNTGKKETVAERVKEIADTKVDSIVIDTLDEPPEFRSAVRGELTCDVALTLVKNGKTYKAKSKDVSANGIRLSVDLDTEISEDSKVVLDFQLPDSSHELPSIKGRIVRIIESEEKEQNIKFYDVGIQFDKFQPVDSEEDVDRKDRAQNEADQNAIIRYLLRLGC